MKDLINKSISTFKSYYVSIILFMVASIEVMMIIYNDYNGVLATIDQTRFVLTFVYGAFFAVVIKFVIDHFENDFQELLYLLVPIVMVLVYYFILSDLNSFGSALKYFILNFLTLITLFSVPFIGTKKDSPHYTYKLLISLGMTMMSYLILIFGIMFTLVSFSTLFEVKILEYIYPMIAIFILGFIMPTTFYSMIPNKDVKVKYPNLVNNIFIYIIAPILGIYTTLLYFYFIKILIGFKIPSNSLGNLTIYYLLISIFILYFVSKNKFNKLVDMLVKYYPYLLILPNIMMLVSFIIRINSYGFTPIRYYGILVFIFVSTSIYLIIKKKNVKYIPIVLSALLLISIIGPLSAFNVSSNSQKKRLEAVLVRNNMFKDNEIIPSDNVSSSDQALIRDILTYFDTYHNLSEIEYLPKGFNLSLMEEVFGFEE